MDLQTMPDGSFFGSRRYDAFGGNLQTTGSWYGPNGYGGSVGYQEVPQSDLKLLWHRYYDSSTGRFLTRDPIKDGENWYGYCGNNPVSGADPTGLAPRKPTEAEKQHLLRQIELIGRYNPKRAGLLSRLLELGKILIDDEKMFGKDGEEVNAWTDSNLEGNWGYSTIVLRNFLVQGDIEIGATTLHKESVHARQVLNGGRYMHSSLVELEPLGETRKFIDWQLSQNPNRRLRKKLLERRKHSKSNFDERWVPIKKWLSVI